MSYLIAVSGKGGVGKTTISSLIVRQLVANGMTPVLAIDADPNSCLDAALGVKVEKTVGGAREEVRQESQNGLTGVSKQEMLQLKISESLVEAHGFDLIAMGRPEGAGCYCYANNVLKSVIAQISGQYPYVVLDNEAGLENLSRRIVQKVDMLVLVADPSNSGMETLKRLYTLANEMEIKYDRLLLIVNRLRSGSILDRIDEIKAFTKADDVIVLEDDAEIASFAEKSENFLQLPDTNKTLKKINELILTIKTKLA
ncbi:MAG: AAA family ATPase [Clostridia bacterium]|nr:AAA family ATPase [Clostridia bacterium]MDR3645085.1 AAA family ATPase [Clostridia bacterium]